MAKPNKKATRTYHGKAGTKRVEIPAPRDAWDILRDNYAEFIKKIAPHLENGFISQDARGMDFSKQEPELTRGTGEFRNTFYWVTTVRGAEDKPLSKFFINIPTHPETKDTLYQIKDGVPYQIHENGVSFEE